MNNKKSRSKLCRSSSSPRLRAMLLPHRLFALCKGFAGLYLCVVFFHASQTEAARCLLAEDCDLERYWDVDDALLQRWEWIWAAASLGALVMPFTKGWQRQLLASALLVCWVEHASHVALRRRMFRS